MWMKQLGEQQLILVFCQIVNNAHLLLTGMLHPQGSMYENITFQVTDDMKPYSKLIVYYFTADGWNADSIYFNAESSADVFRNKVLPLLPIGWLFHSLTLFGVLAWQLNSNSTCAYESYPSFAFVLKGSWTLLCIIQRHRKWVEK